MGVRRCPPDSVRCGSRSSQESLNPFALAMIGGQQRPCLVLDWRKAGDVEDNGRRGRCIHEPGTFRIPDGVVNHPRSHRPAKPHGKLLRDSDQDIASVGCGSWASRRSRKPPQNHSVGLDQIVGSGQHPQVGAPNPVLAVSWDSRQGPVDGFPAGLVSHHLGSCGEVRNIVFDEDLRVSQRGVGLLTSTRRTSAKRSCRESVITPEMSVGSAQEWVQKSGVRGQEGHSRVPEAHTKLLKTPLLALS